MSESIRKEIARCSKCGKCRSVCPVFIETKTEGMVARGRISLAEALLAGEVEDSAKMREYLWGCLKCLRCADTCPAAVDFGAIISEARRLLGSRVGLPWSARIMMRLMVTRRRLFDLSVRAMAVFQKLLPCKAEGKVRHLPLLFGDGRNLPEISPKSVLNFFDEYYGPRDAERKVALFVGCLINYAYPEVARAMVRVLNATGAGVYVPKEQVCCGTPAASLGDYELFERLARANAKAFTGLPVEAVIVGCASGGATLKKEYAQGSLGAPVLDFGEYLARYAGRLKGHFEGKLIWHDPCHMKFVQKITAEPRQLLSQVGDLMKYEGEDYCCGMGGVFSAFFGHLSARIAARKTEAVEKSGGDVLVTGCAGCMMQLRDRLAARGSEVRVMHIAQVLAEALDAEGGSQPREPFAGDPFPDLR